MTPSASAPSSWPLDLRRLPWARIAQAIAAGAPIALKRS